MDSNPARIWINSRPWTKKAISRSNINAGIVNKAAILTKYHFMCMLFVILGIVYILIKNIQVVLVN